ncbi:conjugal transfer protein TraB [Streptomyces lavendulae]|uniref:conjugal transfer protein TraB n=1 Tax=Streptomyces lavendulae TaxID=1914 RepID=UPI00368D0C9D
MSHSLRMRPGALAGSEDHSYQTVQNNLRLFSQTLDNAQAELEILMAGMRVNADRAHTLGTRIEAAELDMRFVYMTHHVGHALTGAARQTQLLIQSASEVSALAESARRTHRDLYDRLDEIRRSRKERTPKPGFLVR